MAQAALDSEEIAILAPLGRDAALIRRALEQGGFLCRIVENLTQLGKALEQDLGAVIITGEGLRCAPPRDLVARLDAQPAWSDLPIIFLASASAAETELAVRDLGNVTVLEKPLRTETLVASVQSALRARRRQYAARAAIREREQFLAMLGHELRNPLGAILFASELLDRRPSAEIVDRQLAIIHRQATHLSRLVDDLLEVSRVTSGKVTLNREVCELGECVERAVQSLEKSFRARSHSLSYSPHQGPLYVNADPVRLEQIFSNLLANAGKYTPDGGRIDVSLAALGKEAVVRVRDTGIGIEKQMLSRIFDLFAQAPATLDRSQGGMGIGLTLVRRLAELHGGSVEAKSEGVGKGSEFVVRIPLTDETGTDLGPPDVAESPRPEPLRLVIVEDSLDICEVFSALLRDEGHDVQIAMDGIRGIELISSFRPDCAFVDIGLPGLDGYQVARRVRAKLGSDMRLVALTGYGQPEDRQRALEAGFDRHLKKPIDLRAVTSLLREVAVRDFH